MSRRLSKSAVFAKLPPPWPHDLRPSIRAAVAAHPDHKVVVIDDDPTGTQTVYGLPVLTSWEVETLRAEFNGPEPCFYILTNSRSLPPEEARELALGLAANLRSAAAACTRSFTLVSRSDSTLRGHFPLETDALAEILGPFDATLLMGQLLPGVPVWRLGLETKFPGLTYVVFPGNVGGPTALAEAVQRLNQP